MVRAIPATKAIDEMMMPALDEEDIRGIAALKPLLVPLGLLFGKTMLSVGACGIPGTADWLVAVALAEDAVFAVEVAFGIRVSTMEMGPTVDKTLELLFEMAMMV